MWLCCPPRICNRQACLAGANDERPGSSVAGGDPSSAAGLRMRVRVNERLNPTLRSSSGRRAGRYWGMDVWGRWCSDEEGCIRDERRQSGCFARGLVARFTAEVDMDYRGGILDDGRRNKLGGANFRLITISYRRERVFGRSTGT